MDNAGAVELSKDLKSCQRSRHIARRYLYARELVEQGEIVVKYIRTDANHADVLTKSLDATTHKRHVEALMGSSVSSGARDATGEASISKMRQRTFDVESAYQKGKFKEKQIYARPPPGKARRFLRGVPIVWRLLVPIYGEADARRVWNRTLVKQLCNVQRFKLSRHDPCLFTKQLQGGTSMAVTMCVDDGYVIDANSRYADAELEQLNAAFKLTLKPAKFF